MSYYNARELRNMVINNLKLTLIFYSFCSRKCKLRKVNMHINIKINTRIAEELIEKPVPLGYKCQGFYSITFYYLLLFIYITLTIKNCDKKRFEFDAMTFTSNFILLTLEIKSTHTHTHIFISRSCFYFTY